MVVYDYRKVPPEERRRMVRELAEIMSTMKKVEDIEYFLTRLLSESEVVMLSRRIKAAEMLVSGLTYEQIRKKIGIGVSTIIGVDKWLTDAAYEYQLVREHKRQLLKQKKIEEKLAKGKRKKVLDHEMVPEEIRGLVRGDTRMILFRLLLKDF